MEMSRSGNVTNLVRSSMSTNDSKKTGDSNVRDLKVFFEANGSYTTVVTATYLETNFSGGSYNPTTGVITLTDITNWTNDQGAPLFDTNPSNFTVKITATASGFDTGSPKEFTIPATLQFANILNEMNFTNNDGALSNLQAINLGNNIAYLDGNKNLTLTANKFTIDKQNSDQSGDVSKAALYEAFYPDITTNENFLKYFSGITFDSGIIDTSDNKTLTYKVVWQPHYTNEMTNASNYEIEFKTGVTYTE